MKTAFSYGFRYLVIAMLVLTTAGVTLISNRGPFNGRTAQAGLVENVLNSAQSSSSDGSAVRDDLKFVDERAVRHFASAYNVDYRVILAMIKQESKFDEAAVSERGAEGLMQLMPVTQSEIMEELGIGDRYMPQQNLQAGIYYFSKLMDLFKGARSEDRLALALAAYNAGPGRVYDAQKLAAYLNEDPNSWASISIVLPLLSVRYSSLHQSVWDSGHPSSGHFGSAKQTIQYVAQVMKSYRLYASADFASGNLASR